MPEGDLQRRLGENLRSYREARDVSQEAFAEELGVHRTYMGAIERGERNLTLKSVERIADCLGIDRWSYSNPEEEGRGRRSPPWAAVHRWPDRTGCCGWFHVDRPRVCRWIRSAEIQRITSVLTYRTGSSERAMARSCAA